MAAAIRLMPEFPLIDGLVDQVMLHSRLYHNSRTKWAEYHRLSELLPPWLRSLNGGLYWAGWWRPTVAFHILFTKSYTQMDARFLDIFRGVRIGDLGELTETQLRRLDALEKHGERVEAWISQGLEAANKSLEGTSVAAPVWEEKVATVESFVTLADELRTSTLARIDAILTPLQRTHFRASGVEMGIRIHEWDEILHLLENIKHLQAKPLQSFKKWSESVLGDAQLPAVTFTCSITSSRFAFALARLTLMGFKFM